MRNERFTERTAVRFTRSDWTLLEQRASAEGLQVAALARKLILAGLGQPMPAMKRRLALGADLRSVLNELLRQGVNLNQVAKKLNSLGSEDEVVAEVLAVIRVHKDVWGRVLQTLRVGTDP